MLQKKYNLHSVHSSSLRTTMHISLGQGYDTKNNCLGNVKGAFKTKVTLLTQAETKQK